MTERAIFKDEVKYELKRPKMYKVILLNDDYTTMEFVVQVLVVIFHKSAADATRIMLDVHEKGKGIVGTYTYDVAITKIIQVEDMAKEREFPLKAIIEEE
ncbi:MAG: ATP-dependent Clp protease adaptor ClpS [Clostridia bacterium]|nr:ATP-dependent Clp protease adaptor ClpS [Clostridia bacterium]